MYLQNLSANIYPMSMVVEVRRVNELGDTGREEHAGDLSDSSCNEYVEHQ